MCTFATGARDPRTVTVGVYTNAQAGPFFLAQHEGPRAEPARCRASSRRPRSRSPAPPTSSPRTGRPSRSCGPFGRRPPARHGRCRSRPQLTALLTARRRLLQLAGRAQTNGVNVGAGSGPVSRSRAAS